MEKEYKIGVGMGKLEGREFFFESIIVILNKINPF
jgi:hypothetical protein